MVAKSNADTTQMKKPIISTETLKPLGLPLSTRELSSGDACTGEFGVDASAADDGAALAELGHGYRGAVAWNKEENLRCKHTDRESHVG